MDKFIDRATGLLEGLAAVLLFAMMAVTFFDVLGRYVIGRPVPGSTEIIQVLLAVSIAFALPAVTWQRQHIGIGLFESRPLGPLERLRRAAVALLSGLAFAALCWLLWRYAGESAANGDVIGYLQLSVAPMVYALSVLSGVTALVFAAIVAASLGHVGGAAPASHGLGIVEELS